MSTTPFRRLFDDAAVFPPGLASVEDAVSDYLLRATGEYADLIGPLLIGTGGAGELVNVVGDLVTVGEDARRDPLPLTLIARPGTPVSDLMEAVGRLRAGASDRVRLVGVEVAHSPTWRTALDLDLPVAVEVDWQAESVVAQLADVSAALAAGLPVRAKLRTQSTAMTPVPDASVLGRLILWCVRHRVPFKLTGGLHHAAPTDVAGAGGATERQHGLLNVMLATELADAEVWSDADARGPESEGPPVLERVIGTLTSTDAPDLAHRLKNLTQDRVSALRGHFTSYGCCGVLDPIGELSALGLLPAPTEGTPADGPPTGGPPTDGPPTDGPPTKDKDD